MICPICEENLQDAHPVAKVWDELHPTPRTESQFSKPGEWVQYYYCPGCQIIFHDQKIPPNYYRGDYRKDVNHSEVVTESNVNLQQARVKTLDPFLRMIVKEDDIKTALDVGSSTGILAARLIELGVQADGVEPGRDFARWAFHHKGIISYPDLSQVRFCKYNLITCIQTLEHISEPVKELNYMRFVGDNPLLLVEVPWFDTSPFALAYVHKYAFTKQGLYNLLERCGWYPLWIIPFYGIHVKLGLPGNLLCLATTEETPYQDYLSISKGMAQQLAKPE